MIDAVVDSDSYFVSTEVLSLLIPVMDASSDLVPDDQVQKMDQNYLPHPLEMNDVVVVVVDDEDDEDDMEDYEVEGYGVDNGVDGAEDDAMGCEVAYVPVDVDG